MSITDDGRVLRLKMWGVYGPMIRRLVRRFSRSGDAGIMASALNELVGSGT